MEFIFHGLQLFLLNLLFQGESIFLFLVLGLRNGDIHGLGGKHVLVNHVLAVRKGDLITQSICTDFALGLIPFRRTCPQNSKSWQ